MTKIELTAAEIKQLKQVKKELLTDSNATPSSQSRNHEILGEIAKKYNVDTQVIYDSIS